MKKLVEEGVLIVIFREQTMAKSAELFYKSFIKNSESKKCCPLCDRGFPKREDLTTFIGRLDQILQTLPAAVEKAAQEVKLAEETHVGLTGLRGDYDNILL